MDEDHEEPEFKSARTLFGDMEEYEEGKKVLGDTKTELPEDVRNFLTAGALLIKHSNTAPPRPRHIFISGDLKTLMWRDTKKAAEDEAKFVKVLKIRSIERGRCTPQLQRKNMWGKNLAKEETSFAIMCRDRTLDLECSSEADREKWVKNLSAWIECSRAKKKAAAKFQ